MYYMRSEQMIIDDAFKATLIRINKIGDIRKEKESAKRRNIAKYNKRTKNRKKN